MPSKHLRELSSQEGSLRLVSALQLEPCPASLSSLPSEALGRLLNHVWLRRQCLGPSFWSLGRELEQAPLLAGMSVSIWGVSLQVFSSLRHQPHSALLLAASHTDKPAAKVPSGRGVPPSVGRKAPPCLRGCLCRPCGPCPRGAFGTLSAF